MLRTIALALLAVATVVAAPVLKKRLKDYQKLADETEWHFPEVRDLNTAARDFHAAVRTELGEYDLKGTNIKAEGIFLRISKDGNELMEWTTHAHAAFAQRNGVLYYTDFHTSASGCKVVAFDLKAKKQLWTCDLKGLGPIDHSKYRNEVRMKVLDDYTLKVFGKESAGRYLEIVDRTTGKTVGHKLFEDEKK